MPKTIRPEAGQALVEFSLVIIILFFVVMGIFDLGRGIYAYNVVASAAREGAHYGITNPNQEKIRDQATRTAVLDLDRNRITLQCSPCTTDKSLTVTVSYTFQPVTLFFAPFTVTGKSTMTIE
jgi:Flp pilus assembly protein TadG